MACTEILLGVMLLGAWPSNLLTLVRATLQTLSAGTDLFACTEMLTPVDHTLDKLEDLKPDEMCVFSCFV
jgi:hypothetical protein